MGNNIFKVKTLQSDLLHSSTTHPLLDADVHYIR